ncbi:hypothetical protein OG735_03660 [Streptomyces sp. NBC_01210]|uniref:hypothetical protein n=1 Tax=Streptomyces sp. NBC_01210 TaxID=2903774 RepID=UPI002E123EBB|nr:hypothetical protein OG735_03660 [Streptomyces sp. NBC_01210]
MTWQDATPQEDLYLRVVSDLQNADEIEVFSDLIEIDDEESNSLGIPLRQRAEEIRGITQERPEWDGVIIDQEIEERGLRFYQIGSHWRTRKPLPRVTGEFFLPMFYDSLFSSAPDLAWTGSTDDERQLYSEFRVIDSQPNSGSDLLTTVRLQPDSTPLEMWVWDPRVGPKKMGLDYSTYLEMLALTKGAYGWQYLFTDVSLADDLFHHTAESIRNMLDIFPRIFPSHDYTSLAARLAERL